MSFIVSGLIGSAIPTGDGIPGLDAGAKPDKTLLTVENSSLTKIEAMDNSSKKKPTEPVKSVNLKSHDKTLKQ